MANEQLAQLAKLLGGGNQRFYTAPVASAGPVVPPARTSGVSDQFLAQALSGPAPNSLGSGIFSAAQSISQALVSRRKEQKAEDDQAKLKAAFDDFSSTLTTGTPGTLNAGEVPSVPSAEAPMAEQAAAMGLDRPAGAMTAGGTAPAYDPNDPRMRLAAALATSGQIMPAFNAISSDLTARAATREKQLDRGATLAAAQIAARARPAKTVTTAEGVFTLNPDGSTGARIGSAPSSITTEVKLPPQQTKEAETVGKFFGDQYVDLQKAGTAATAQNAQLSQLDQLLDRVYTGAGTETGLTVQKAAKRLGFDIDIVGDTGAAEAAGAIANEMALQLRNPAGGAGMPGAMSDQDRGFLQSMVPGLGQTKEGRKLLIDARRRVNQRSVDVSRLAREYRKKNGRIDEGFGDVLDQYSRDNPLFTKDDFTRLEALSGSGAADTHPEGTILDPIEPGSPPLIKQGGKWVPFNG